MNGQWLPASKFDFDDMVRKEGGYDSQAYVHVQQTTTQHTDQSHVRVPRGRIDPDISAMSSSERYEYASSEFPSEINKWNWGAFCLNWIWGICNGVYWPLVLIICNFIPYIGFIIILGCCVALGMNGSKWAWKGKRWNSIEHFKRVQHNWALASLWIFGISFVFGFLAAIAAAL